MERVTSPLTQMLAEALAPSPDEQRPLFYWNLDPGAESSFIKSAGFADNIEEIRSPP